MVVVVGVSERVIEGGTHPKDDGEKKDELPTVNSGGALSNRNRKFLRYMSDSAAAFRHPDRENH
jgi:hypothetical protein